MAVKTYEYMGHQLWLPEILNTNVSQGVHSTGQLEITWLYEQKYKNDNLDYRPRTELKINKII